MASCLLYLALGAAFCLTGLAARGQDAGSDKSQAAVGAHAGEMPVVDFTASDDPAEARLRAKSRRYDLKNDSVDKSRFVLKESDPAQLFELPGSHAPERPALPAAQSDVVVIGQVVGSEAHLSDDRTGVYSEFTVLVGEVLKNSSGREVGGGTLTADRSGGGVRFPSGKVLRRGRLRETMPRVGGRYVLFLGYDKDADAFSIITGYELRGGRVFPLDGVEVPEGGSKLKQFAAYEGAEEPAFLDEVRSALKSPDSKKGTAERGR